MTYRRLPSNMIGLSLLGAAALAAYLVVVRPWHLRWGATDEEVARSWPGDELAPRPKLRTTHVVTMAISPAKIRPWLVQIGQGRGGFYSYDWIENLMGLDIHSADRLLPQFQEMKGGDVVSLAPNGFGLPVASSSRSVPLSSTATPI